MDVGVKEIFGFDVEPACVLLVSVLPLLSAVHSSGQQSGVIVVY